MSTYKILLVPADKDQSNLGLMLVMQHNVYVNQSCAVQ